MCSELEDELFLPATNPAKNTLFLDMKMCSLVRIYKFFISTAVAFCQAIRRHVRQEIIVSSHRRNDRLCGLVVRVSGYRYRGLGFDSRRYQIFWVVVSLERGPLSLVRSIKELLE